MAGWSRWSKASSRGLLSNYRYLCKKAMMLRAMESARARKKRRQKMMITDAKRKRMESQSEPVDTNELVKIAKASSEEKEPHSSLNSENKRTEGVVLRDSWEVDSGFSSEASPPASGRSSPCSSTGPTALVALDCEMVGTGPRGCCSELARCSILDYHGNVLYDKYVRPRQPVTDYRTRWSGIRRHHLENATPFAQAREEILCILEGRVVVGHSIYNDFEALDMLHPTHMVRDTGATRLLSRLAGFPRERCASLKVLASKLLNRKIQVGRRGHCSVEDAKASLDLYKLVEGEWEWEAQSWLKDDDDAPQQPSFASSKHYMQDEYWPDELAG